MDFINEYSYNKNRTENEEIEELKNKIILLQNDKNYLESRISELIKGKLENKLNEDVNENENKEIKNKIKNLNNKLSGYEKENKDLKNKIKNLNNKFNEDKNKIISNSSLNNNNNKDKLIELMDKLLVKEKEINDIKSILPYELKKGDKLMTIIFYSVDQKIHYSLICKNTDKFSVIEQKLFEIFPDCQEENYYFLANGIRINRFKTLEELKLKNSSIITMNIPDFE